MLSRRSFLCAATAVGAASVTANGLLPTVAGGPAPAASATTRTPAYTFVSMPDFFNGDVADLTGLPTWDGGLNSVNTSWDAAIDKCLGAVAAHEPDSVFLAGDMVEGRWNIDSDDRRLFGPVSQGTDAKSIAMCKAAIRSAGDTYYGYHKQLFASRGLTVFPCVGDHELLDDRTGPLNDRWSPRGSHNGDPDNRYYLVDHAKHVWADHFTRNASGAARFAHRPVGTASEFTAYRVNLGPKLTLITVDMFHKTRRGVDLGVFQGQLRWLRTEIKRAKSHGRVVIVQGHVPTMVPYRTWHSGNLYLPERRHSPFYQALESCGADFFFTGEVHDTTVIQRGPRKPIQISHGCIFRYGFNYLVGKVYADGTVHLAYYEVPLLAASRDKQIWSADAKKRQRTTLEYGEPVRRGTLVVKNHRILERTKKLGVYHPADDRYAYETHNRTVLT